MTTLLTILVIATAVVLAVHIASSQKRHKRLKQRVKHYEKMDTDLLRARKDLYAMRAERVLAAQNKQPALPLRFTSEYGESMLLFDLFEGQTSGYFIECGAYDGTKYSVTYPFEAMGWTGLLVEAIPDRFEKCRAARPNSRCEHAALSRTGSAGTATFTVFDDDFFDLCSHLNEEGWDEAAFAKRKHIESRKVVVPLTTMDNLLADTVQQIDFAVLDVEGGELDLLDGFDLNKYKPRAILIEDLNKGGNPDLDAYLRKYNYEEIMWLSYNRLYIRSDEPELLARGRVLAQQLKFPLPTT